MNDTGFDYQSLGSCQCEIPDPSRASGISDCGEMAVAKCWWHPDTQHTLLVCQKHFDEIREIEEKNKMSRWILYIIVYFVFTWIALCLGAWLGIKGHV